MPLHRSTKHVIAALTLGLAALGACAQAQDSLESRQAAADRYLKVVPMAKMLDDSFAQFAQMKPEEERPGFIMQMKALVRADMIERVSREAMIKTFSTDELNALADFYGSKNGASAMRKFGVYMAEVMPVVQQEIQQAARKLLFPKTATEE